MPNSYKQMNIKLKLAAFTQRIFLFRQQPWLKQQEVAFEQLMADCNNKNEENLLIDLLARFKYIYRPEYDSIIDQFCNQIVNVYNISEAETQLVALEVSYLSDSSQEILYNVRTHISSYGWFKPHHCSTITKAVRHADSKPNIIIFDEFIGSGKTLANNIDHLTKELAKAKNVSIDDIKIRICVLAAMRDGLDNIKDLGLDIFVPNILDKGISAHFDNPNKNIAIGDMLRIESILSPRIDDEPLPSFGFNKSESLYGRESGNGVTNVFPIFWWRLYLDDQRRNTLLRRTR